MVDMTKTAFQRALHAMEHLEVGSIFTNADIASIAKCQETEVSNAKTRLERSGCVKRINYRLWVRCENGDTLDHTCIPVSDDTEKLCKLGRVVYVSRSNSLPNNLKRKRVYAKHEAAETGLVVGDQVRVIKTRSKTIKIGDVGVVHSVQPKAISVIFNGNIYVYLAKGVNASLEKIVDLDESHSRNEVNHDIKQNDNQATGDEKAVKLVFSGWWLKTLIVVSLASGMLNIIAFIKDMSR